MYIDVKIEETYLSMIKAAKDSQRSLNYGPIGAHGRSLPFIKTAPHA